MAVAGLGLFQVFLEPLCNLLGVVAHPLITPSIWQKIHLLYATWLCTSVLVGVLGVLWMEWISPSIPSDVNECAVNNGRCEQNCINNGTTYYCNCSKGILAGNGFNCTGILDKKFQHHKAMCACVCIYLAHCALLFPSHSLYCIQYFLMCNNSSTL